MIPAKTKAREKLVEIERLHTHMAIIDVWLPARRVEGPETDLLFLN